MSKDILTRRLRPYLFSAFKRSPSPSPARPFVSCPPCLQVQKDAPEQDVTRDYQKRYAQLISHKSLSELYPRLSQETSVKRQDAEAFRSAYGYLRPGETAVHAKVVVAGTTSSVRSMGSKLLFLDIESLNGKVQTVSYLSKVQEHHPEVTPEQFRVLGKTARAGDAFSVEGYPHRTERGELSILATQIPTLLSPSFHQIPASLRDDAELRARSRHVDMLVDPGAAQTLRVRHEVEAGIQDFLNRDGFIKVNTPILSAGAGGAAARPFETEATELSGETLNLRVAPELWLKRLVVGGVERVYELGPAFRNEGVDATHNPEFTICEFYQAYATLRDLMDKTKKLFGHLKTRIESVASAGHLSDIPLLDKDLQLDAFDEIELIPGLEEKLSLKFPDLESPHASSEILQIFRTRDIPVPSNPTLPRLLDALSSQYLEPLSSINPLFVTHHPACMSPLSKHFACPRTGQMVSARAELFIAGREFANMYEEENSPFEQRRKMEEQLRQREVDEEAMEVDESYLKALEWGLPPTGGWGCGVDRMVMLFSGRRRMADVLAFGTLRNVVGLGKGKGKGKGK